MIYRTSYLKILCPVTFTILLFLYFIGCAHVPKESVELSTVVNKGIEDQHRAYQNLFNAYFNLKKEKIDDWIKTKYIPLFLVNIRSIMKTESKNEIDDEGMNYIINAIIEKRDSMQIDLEKTKVLLWERISDDQTLLLNASDQITSLLQSVTDVQEATKQLMQNASKATGIDFMEIDKVFDEYLSKSGEVTGKGNILSEEVKSLINGGK